MIATPMIPSGKQPHNYGKITIFHGKTHYFYGHFPSFFVSLPEGSPPTVRITSAARQQRLERRRGEDARHRGEAQSTTGATEASAMRS